MIAVVTGGSSGMGLGAVKSLIASGCRVYELSRRDFEYEGLTHMKLDVTDESAVHDVISAIIEKEGRIDILINCAGFGISGAVEFTDSASARKQLDVNFFGMVNVTKEVLPGMREQGGGRIVNISSVAAAAPIPFQTFYSASKAAINAYTEALACEVRPYGISVTAVMPGDINTGFTKARQKSENGDREYSGRISRGIHKMELDEINGMDADTAGKYIAGIALKKKVKQQYTLGFVYKLDIFLCKVLPIRTKNWIIFKMYG